MSFLFYSHRWFLFGSIFITAASAIVLANSYNEVIGSDDSFLSRPAFRASWALLVVSGVFCTIGSVRAWFFLSSFFFIFLHLFSFLLFTPSFPFSFFPPFLLFLLCSLLLYVPWTTLPWPPFSNADISPLMSSSALGCLRWLHSLSYRTVWWAHVLPWLNF